MVEKICLHNKYTVHRVKNGKETIVYMKCNDCGAVLPN